MKRAGGTNQTQSYSQHVDQTFSREVDEDGTPGNGHFHLTSSQSSTTSVSRNLSNRVVEDATQSVATLQITRTGTTGCGEVRPTLDSKH